MAPAALPITIPAPAVNVAATGGTPVDPINICPSVNAFDVTTPAAVLVRTPSAAIAPRVRLPAVRVRAVPITAAPVTFNAAKVPVPPPALIHVDTFATIEVKK